MMILIFMYINTLLYSRPHRVGALSVVGHRLSVHLSVLGLTLSRQWKGV